MANSSQMRYLIHWYYRSTRFNTNLGASHDITCIQIQANSYYCGAGSCEVHCFDPDVLETCGSMSSFELNVLWFAPRKIAGTLCFRFKEGVS